MIRRIVVTLTMAWLAVAINLGISLVQNYRGAFDAEIEGNGLDALIRQLSRRDAERGRSP